MSKRSPPVTRHLPDLDGHTAREAAGSPEHPDRILAELPIGTPDYIRVLGAILKKHNGHHSSKHKSVSLETMVDRQRFLASFFRELRRRTPYKRADPRELTARHVSHMARRWVQRGLSTATIHNYLSFLRSFAAWIGKPGLVREPAFYVGKASPHAHRSFVAQHDHSWTAKNIDIAAKIDEVIAFDPHVGTQLAFCHLFGLRPKEARHLRLDEAIIDRTQADARDAAAFPEAQNFVRISRGSKGGRRRDIPIATDDQRQLIDRARALCPSGTALGAPALTAMQAQSRFYYVVRKFGISKRALGIVPHGLRHQRVNDQFTSDTGAPSAVRGAVCRAPNEHDARQRATRLLGHARLDITNGYLGSSARLPAATQPAASAATDAQVTVREGAAS
jgi:integrase